MSVQTREVDAVSGVPNYQVHTYLEPRARHALVIPVINEGERIRRQIEAIASAAPEVDVYLADGGSTDGTLGPWLEHSGLSATLVKTGPGKLSAQLRMGFHHTLSLGYDGILTMDGNGKDDPDGIARILAALEDGVDFVQGSRFVPGGFAENTPRLRRLGIRFVHAPLTSLAAHRWFTDTTNGFRGHSRSLLVDPRVSVFRDVFDTYELLAYLPIRAGQLHYATREVPVARRYPEHGPTPTRITGLHGNLELLTIVARAAMSAYSPGRQG